MTGPLWLTSFVAALLDDTGALKIRSKGFIVSCANLQIAKAPKHFHSVQCYFILTPDYVMWPMTGTAEPRLIIRTDLDMPDGQPVSRGD